jgi:hypothetical protein
MGILLGIVLLDWLWVYVRFQFILTNSWVRLVWFGFPPLLPVLTLTLGPMFVVFENSKNGRLYASANLLSLLNVLVVMCVAIGCQRDQWILNIIDAGIEAGIKLALCFYTTMHCRNLENHNDLLYIVETDATQANYFIHETVVHAYSGKRDRRQTYVRELSRRSNSFLGSNASNGRSRAMSSYKSSLGNRNQSFTPFPQYPPQDSGKSFPGDYLSSPSLRPATFSENPAAMASPKWTISRSRSRVIGQDLDSSGPF